MPVQVGAVRRTLWFLALGSAVSNLVVLFAFSEIKSPLSDAAQLVRVMMVIGCGCISALIAIALRDK